VTLAAELDLMCKLLDHLLDPPPYRDAAAGEAAYTEAEERAKRGISRDREVTPPSTERL